VDETLHGERAARELVALDGPRVWNVKVHRMGGLTEVCRVVALARGHGVRLWAGTMPESGLGSQAALAAAALPEFVYPSDLEPSARWFGPAADVIELDMSPDGWMDVPATAIAGRLDRALFRRVTRRLD
jgi:O-succinylbenzoate synthase